MTQDEIIAAVNAAPDAQTIPIYEGCGCGCGYQRSCGTETRSVSVGYKITDRIKYQYPPSACHTRKDFEAGAGAEQAVERL